METNESENYLLGEPEAEAKRKPRKCDEDGSVSDRRSWHVGDRVYYNDVGSARTEGGTEGMRGCGRRYAARSQQQSPSLEPSTQAVP